MDLQLVNAEVSSKAKSFSYHEGVDYHLGWTTHGYISKKSLTTSDKFSVGIFGTKE